MKRNWNKHKGCLISALVWYAATSFALAAPICKVTLRVIDEDGQPVLAADAGVTFARGNRFETTRDKTNSNGLFSAEGEAFNHIAFGAVKEGYYHTGGSTNFIRYIGNRWQPWNPTFDLVLKKILNPVPMYARGVETEIPIIGQAVGYDLMEADWVAPHGKGQKADFVFKLQRRFNSREDYEATLELSFSNPGDGVQSVLAPVTNRPDELRLPHQAPEQGYEPKWSRTHSSEKGAMLREDQNYFFRVRSEQKDGNIQQAFYGKIHGEIILGRCLTEKPVLRFTYYLNPDGTRNVEFDPKRNLYKGNVRSWEQVNAP